MEGRNPINSFEEFNFRFRLACKQRNEVNYQRAIEAYPKDGGGVLSVNDAKLIDCYVSLARIYYDDAKWPEMGKSLIEAARLMEPYYKLPCRYDKNKFICITDFKESVQLMMRHQYSPYKKQYVMIQAHLIVSSVYTSQPSLWPESAITAFSKGMELILITVQSNPNYPVSLMTQLCHSMDCLRGIKTDLKQRVTIQKFFKETIKLIEEHPESISLFSSEDPHFNEKPQGFHLSTIQPRSCKIFNLFNVTELMHSEWISLFGYKLKESTFDVEERMQYKQTMHELLDDLEKSSTKSKYKKFLKSVCRLNLATLSDHSISEKKFKQVFDELKKGWEFLLAIKHQENEVHLKKLYEQLPKKYISEIDKRTLESCRENFHQAVMLSYLNLSKTYFKECQYQEAIILLECANRYYRICDRQRECVKEYEQQFTGFFNTVIEIRLKQCKNKTDDDFKWERKWGREVLVELKNLSKMALHLSKQNHIPCDEESFHHAKMFGYLSLSEREAASKDFSRALFYLKQADRIYQTCDKQKNGIDEYEQQFGEQFKRIMQQWDKFRVRHFYSKQQAGFDLSANALPLLKNDPDALKILNKFFSDYKKTRDNEGFRDLIDTAKLIDRYVSLGRIYYDAKNWPEMAKALSNAADPMQYYKIEGIQDSLIQFYEKLCLIVKQECSLYKKQVLMAQAYIKLSLIYFHSKGPISSSIAALRTGFELLIELPLSIRRTFYNSKHVELFDVLNKLMAKKNKSKPEQREIKKFFEQVLKSIKECDYDSSHFASCNKDYEKFRKNRKIDCVKLSGDKIEEVTLYTDIIVEERENWLKSNKNKVLGVDCVKQNREFINDVSASKYKNKFTELLWQECTINLAVLCEYHVNDDCDVDLAIEGMQRAANHLLPMYPESRSLYAQKAKLLQMKDVSVEDIPSYKNVFYQAIMFAFLNLSKSYFNNQKFSSALRILLHSHQYYQLCDQETFSAKQYQQQFRIMSTLIINTLIKHCKNKLAFDFDWNIDEFCLDRLCRLNEAPSSLLGNNSHLGQAIYVLFFALLKYETDLEKKSEIFCDFINDGMKYLSTSQHKKLMQTFISIVRNILHQGKFSKAGEMFKQALPLIRLCADPDEMKEFDVEHYKRTCTVFINIDVAKYAKSLGDDLLEQVIMSLDSFPKAFRRALLQNTVQAYDTAIKYFPKITLFVDQRYVALVDCHISLAALFEENKQWIEMTSALSEAEKFMKKFQKDHSVLKVLDTSKLISFPGASEIIASETKITLNDYIQARTKRTRLPVSSKYVIAMMYINLSMMYASDELVKTNSLANRVWLNRALKTFALGFNLLKKHCREDFSPYLQYYLKVCIQCLMEMPLIHEHQDELKFLKAIIKDASIDENARLARKDSVPWKVFKNNNQIHAINEILDFALVHALDYVKRVFMYLLNFKDDWLDCEKSRNSWLKGISGMFDQLKAKKIKTKYNPFLQTECKILFAVLCEHRLPNKKEEILPAIHAMKNAATFLSFLAINRSDKMLMVLCDHLQKISSPKSSVESFHAYTNYFNNALMFTYINLSQMYINKGEITQAIRVLEIANRYYKVSTKKKKGANEYLKRFIPLFNKLVQMRIADFENNDSRYADPLLKFEYELAMVALPLLAKDEKATAEFHRMMNMRPWTQGKNLGQLEANIDFYRESGICPLHERLNYVYDLIKRASYAVTRYTSAERVYLVEGFALIAGLRESHSQIPQIKKFLLEALPLIRLYADSSDKRAGDVEIFQQRCEALTTVESKQASGVVLPMLCLQLELQACVMYYENGEPIQALWTLSAALEGYKDISDPSAMKRDDYKRLINCVLLFKDFYFSLAEDNKYLENCIREVSTIIKFQKVFVNRFQSQFSKLLTRVTAKRERLSRKKNPQVDVSSMTLIAAFEEAKINPSKINYKKAIKRYPVQDKTSFDKSYVSYVDCYISLAAFYYENKKFTKMGTALRQAAELMHDVQHIRTTPYFARDITILHPNDISIIEEASHALELGRKSSVPEDFLMIMAYLKLSAMYTSCNIVKPNDQTNTAAINLALDAFSKGIVVLEKTAKNMIAMNQRLEIEVFKGMRCLKGMPFALKRHEKENHRFKLLIEKVIGIFYNKPYYPTVAVLIRDDHLYYLGRHDWYNTLLNKRMQFENGALWLLHNNAREKLNRIMRCKSDWMNDDKFRQKLTDKILKAQNELKNMRVKDASNDFLQRECIISQAVLCENRKMTESIKAGKILKSLACISTDKVFNALCDYLLQDNNGSNRVTHFNQALMFAYLNLSEAYIKQRQHKDAVRVLSFADRYYQASNKKADNMESYRQRFVCVFKQLVDIYLKNSNESNIGLTYSHANFEVCALTALPLLKKDKTALEKFYRIMNVLGGKNERIILEEGVELYRLPESYFSSNLRIDLIYKDLSSCKLIRYPAVNHIYFLRGFILVIQKGLFGLHKNRYSWMKNFSLKALPLIRLYADGSRTDTTDVKTFQQRCERVVTASPKEADEFIIPMLQIQLLLQASVMYCNKVKKPEFALKTFCEAFKILKLIPKSYQMESTDYRRFTKSILRIGRCHFSTTEHWDCLKTCLVDVWSMFRDQKMLTQEDLTQFPMHITRAAVGKDNLKKTTLTQQVVTTSSQPSIPVRSSTFNDTANEVYASLKQYTGSLWKMIPDFGKDVDKDSDKTIEMTERTQLIKK